MRNRWTLWIASILLWSTLGLLFALPGLLSHSWNHAVLGSLAQWWSWGLVTPLIIRADALLPFKEKQLGMRVLAHLFASVPLTLLYYYVVIAVSVSLGLGRWSALPHPPSVLNAFGLLWSWVVYWVIFGVILTFRYHEQYRASELRLERMESNLSQSRLNALRMQLDPHFLFNALNTISSQVERNPRLARTMIEHLGDLLRLSLSHRRSPATKRPPMEWVPTACESAIL
jgi:two-component system, LytTR family, sensor kinase